MKFDLQKSIDIVLDETISLPLRSIELFTFLVALHMGSSLTKISGHRSLHNEPSSLTLDIPRKTIRAARFLSAMKFLDRIEQDWQTENRGAKPSIRKMIRVREYEEIVNRVIFRNGGWYRMRFLDSVRDLEADVEELKKPARNVARLIEFSVRFEPNPEKPKQIGGVTMATDIVTRAIYFKVKGKDSQLEQAWSRLRSAAPFLYLIYVQKYPFFLKKVAGSRLPERLCRLIEDRERLMDFLRHYNFVADHLRNRGYRYSTLSLPAGVGKEFQRDPFRKTREEERAVLDHIERYQK